MLDVLFKLLLIGVVSPIWLPILRSIREQMEEIEAQEREREDRGRVGKRSQGGFRRDHTPPTVNEDLVEETYAPVRSGSHAFRSESADAPGGGLRPYSAPASGLRRAG